MSIFEDAWKTVFGDSGDAVDKAGDEEQARIIQAIDLINTNLDSIQGELSAGKDEFVATVKDTIAKMKTEILNGNIDVANKLKTGLEEKISGLSKTYDLSAEKVVNAYGIIQNDLNTAKATSQGYLDTARANARSDITGGQTNAISRLRTSLTNQLDAISRGRDSASQSIRSALETTRKDYAPYIAAGQKSITRAEQLTNDPNAQKEYVTNNPFFSAMQETARDQLFSNQAARGRLGTGETLDELDKRTLLLGEQLVGNAIDRNLGVSNQGLNAINNMATSEMNGANILAQIFQNSGLAEAAAEQGFGNTAAEIDFNSGNILAQIEKAFGQDSSQLTQTTANNLAEIGANFTGMLNSNLMNLGTMGAQAEAGYWDALTNLVNNQTQQHAQLTGQAGFMEADAQQGYRNAYADLIGWGNSSIVPLLTALGQSEANETIGEQNAQTQGFNTLLNIAALAMGMPGFMGNKTPSPTSTGTTTTGSAPPLSGPGFYGGSSVNYGGGFSLPSIPYYNPTPAPSNYGFNLNLRT